MRQLKNFRSENAVKPDTPDLSRYEGMDENQLMAELMRAVAAAKSDGSFSREQIDSFVSFVAPSLDEASRARLNELVGIISG